MMWALLPLVRLCLWVLHVRPALCLGSALLLRSVAKVLLSVAAFKPVPLPWAVGVGGIPQVLPHRYPIYCFANARGPFPTRTSRCGPASTFLMLATTSWRVRVLSIQSLACSLF